LIDCAVILAVGNPAHQSRLTYDRPRTMLPVLGKPLVVRAMDRLYRIGIQEFIVVVGEEEGAVAAYLNTQWVPNARIEFVMQTASDSLTRILADIARRFAKPFLITSYNSFTHAHFPERLIKHYETFEDSLILSGATSTLSKSTRHFFALTQDGNRATSIVTEAPTGDKNLTLTDLAILGQKVIHYLATSLPPTGTFSKQLMSTFDRYIRAGGPAFTVEAAWLLQIQTDYDLLTLNKHLLDEGQDAYILSELPGTVQIIPPVRIDPHVSIGPGAKIGPYVYLENGCSIGHHATVSNAMILRGAMVSSGETVSNAIVSTRARITD
jgi:UDP-N-acetylglucosamine diphosphorylase / glucose-1-phosphate thymidylyltransferase / UDP-N-acetylgalactosamine diphosphorylase / glucosamine-1-phosphate N-acetyltransferase / galactosamine-1-phosphate N-acetyltransferase